MVKKFLLTLCLFIGCSLAAFGQKDDKKDPPPKKGDKPVVVPRDKEKPRETPKPTPKKPENQLIGGGRIGDEEIG
jgi:hypothetical protein